MTRRGGKEALEKISGIGRRRGSRMVQLAARWRRSNLVILVTLKKENHPGEAYVRKGEEKLYIEDRRIPHKGPMWKQRLSIKPPNKGKTWSSVKIHV